MHHGIVSADIANGLLALKARIEDAKIPSSRLDESINIAVWNIREFGRTRRTEAAIHYIAEIIGQFDLVAIVELRSNLEDLGRVMSFLGDYWKVVFSDWDDDPGANDERTAFLYDRRAVIHSGLAAEIGAPRVRKGTEWVTEESFWRAPYLCSFRAGNFDFLALALHARWGDSTAARADELKRLSHWIETRFKSKYVEDNDLIVMGDFNTPSLTDPTFAALTSSSGLQIPESLVKLKVGDRVIGGSDLGKNARYDQILHRATVPSNFCNTGGALDFFIDDSKIGELFPGKKNYTRAKFTYQLSDHLPIWIQVKTDISTYILNQIIRGS
jgi:hypothetical protein